MRGSRSSVGSSRETVPEEPTSGQIGGPGPSCRVGSTRGAAGALAPRRPPARADVDATTCGTADAALLHQPRGPRARARPASGAREGQAPDAEEARSERPGVHAITVTPLTCPPTAPRFARG